MKSSIYMAAAISMMAACSKPDINAHALSDASLNADFTITPVAGSANKFRIAVADSSYIYSKWNIDGQGAAAGRHSMELFLPDAGPYTIQHTAVGKGGTSFLSEVKTINVATNDPSAPNLVQGGRFASAADDAKWTRLAIGSNAVVWNMANGKMTVSGGNGGHAAIYQAITVEANKDYKFSMNVSGSGATDVWFEVYFGTTAPVQGSDYSSGGTQMGLNTWEGCGKSAFVGNLNEIGCVGALKDKKGVVRFANAGTIYLVIKSGGANMGTSGISIDNVELRRVV